MPTYGAYLFFRSNSCAAYNNEALEAVGGFREVLLGEDTCAVAALLYAGQKFAYVSEAVVRHSHGYSLKQEFKRDFDTGLMRRQFKELQEIGASDAKRGWTYFRKLMKELATTSPQLIPYGLLETMTKYIGYFLGTVCVNAPVSLKRQLQQPDFYWIQK